MCCVLPLARVFTLRSRPQLCCKCPTTHIYICLPCMSTCLLQVTVMPLPASVVSPVTSPVLQNTICLHGSLIKCALPQRCLWIAACLHASLGSLLAHRGRRAGQSDEEAGRQDSSACDASVHEHASELGSGSAEEACSGNACWHVRQNATCCGSHATTCAGGNEW